MEYFTSIEEKMPLSAAPEPKRRFVPSKHEAKRVMQLVRAIREGKIQPVRGMALAPCYRGTCVLVLTICL